MNFISFKANVIVKKLSINDRMEKNWQNNEKSIGRPSILSNPFKIKIVKDRDLSLDMYEQYFVDSVINKKDVQKIQKEQMRLYQEAGINPASGCLVMIIQIAIFLSFYNTLMFFLMTQDNLVEKINASLYSSALHIENLDLSFFGFDLASTPHMGPWWYISIPVVTALFQFLQANAMSAMSGMMSVPTSQKDGKKDDMPNFQQIFATQMKYVFPFMIGFASYNLPIGLALYWNILSIFSIIQYRGGDIWIKTKSSLNKPKILLEESSTTSTLK